MEPWIGLPPLGAHVILWACVGRLPVRIRVYLSRFPTLVLFTAACSTTASICGGAHCEYRHAGVAVNVRKPSSLSASRAVLDRCGVAALHPTATHPADARTAEPSQTVAAAASEPADTRRSTATQGAGKKQVGCDQTPERRAPARRSACVQPHTMALVGYLQLDQLPARRQSWRALDRSSRSVFDRLLTQSGAALR